MTLPVSMDDKELFPKVDILNLTFSPKSEVNEDVLKQMFTSLDRLWWSRLVISVRGYVINYVQQNDEVLFSCDDAFIKIHQKLAERNSKFENAFEYLTAIFHLIREKNTLIQLISNPKTISATKLPPVLEQSFGVVHGDLSPKAIQLTIAQLPAYTMFIKVVVNLQQRWENEKLKKKSIRFETDPEWEPDERVVLFQTFASDNRTWVLLDFDRYILQQWKPNGTSVIFGDRFVEKKKRSGLKLCTTCGMLEQKKAQFAILNDQVYCSKTCFDEVNPPMTVNNRGATVVHL
ncbi:hypothetical protein GCK72_024775 [Caenorhabditis remanei]|uniref:DUF8117 domain-containing protein n=1 Tax=Caenorhabditis remanei TaxID=31234 RepID=A0A6A5G057_CAERE|nr:hypothetical protein GCK72_024775 [Caenorhabditis remanei]KAF1748308.1 hypothetical protein GCK72_024775 [Caenorhabditis remanei]